ncbi:hypothetical protein GGX14DRAFT_571753 [Mycena pura]|uniref:Uncharacterized protein n=1 Tax=Mycena pura TaxID=153505 RepID=A0AAD6V4L7_9AGAR|nr:hypothetical protein GGX14DRAFT_571753 [Mycena pura]
MKLSLTYITLVAALAAAQTTMDNTANAPGPDLVQKYSPLASASAARRAWMSPPAATHHQEDVAVDEKPADK